jgi:ABC-type lipoprotein release transport system permease subunit
LLVIVVAYATMAIIFFWGFTDGFLDSVMNGQARFVSAPGMITTISYHEDPDPENALPELQEFIEIAATIPQIERVAPRLEFPGLIRSPYATEGVQVRGVDPRLEDRVSNIPANIGQGRMLEAQGEVVLGTDLAEEIDVRLGERLAMDAASVSGPQATGLIVVGLVDTGISIIDETVVLIHLDDARSLTGIDTATGLALDIPFGQEDTAVENLRPRLGSGIGAYSVTDLLGALQEGLASERAQTIPLGLIFSIFAALTVTSTVVVSILERTREFGIIVALGLDQHRLSWLVILEAIFATLIGYAVGLVLGYGINLVFNTWNILGPFFGNLYGDIFSAFALSDEIYATMSAEYLIYSGFTIALAGLFAMLAPAGRIRRLNPAEAMRTE